jgi:superfamily II DNA or RNA helicase
VEVYEAPRAFRERLLSLAPREDGDLRSFTLGSRPRPRSLFDHQRTAIDNWKAAGCRGILQHATGSGKTLTALHAVRDWITERGPALVIVPSTLLLEQWFQEAERELGVLEPSILLVGGGHDEWRNGSLLRVHTEPGQAPRVTIATVQTAATSRFIDSVRDGKHLLVVADEVHRLGSKKYRDALAIDGGGRLGLSATPLRARDEEGTEAVLDYFGGVIAPVFGLHDAIAAGRLCPYEYHVHLVDLSEDEATKYRELTSKIGQAMGAAGADRNGYLEYLLIQRARIIKQATAKAGAAAAIVLRGLRDRQHWLVYCDDQRQVREVLAILREAQIDAFEYHSNMRGDRSATMDHFRTFGGVLVAIRCLDEGADLPEVTHAVIAASSKNVREFIQRRGRVLRTAPGKRIAVVHDLLVRPPAHDTDGERSPFAAIAEAEIARAAEFARDAVNVATRNQLIGLCIEWDIDQDVLL